MPFFDDVLFDGGEAPLIPAPPTPPPGYLGRFQLGQTVPLLVAPVDGAGYPTVPDAAPTVVVADADGGEVVAAKLAMRGDPNHFGLDLFLGFAFALGTYQVSYSFVVAGQTRTSAGSFDLVGGGDPGGGIISMATFVRPEATYVVAQLASGNLVQGRNPTI